MTNIAPIELLEELIDFYNKYIFDGKIKKNIKDMHNDESMLIEISVFVNDYLIFTTKSSYIDPHYRYDELNVCAKEILSHLMKLWVNESTKI